MIESGIKNYPWLSICNKASKLNGNQKQIGTTSIWNNMFGTLLVNGDTKKGVLAVDWHTSPPVVQWFVERLV